MRKLAVLILFMTSVGYSQDEVAPAPPVATTDETSSLEDPISRFNRYAPSTKQGYHMDPMSEEEDYATINRIIKDTIEVFAPIIGDYMDVGARIYYEKMMRNFRDPYRFKGSVDFYTSASSTANMTSKLDQNIDILTRASKKFKDIREVLVILEKTPEDLANIDYEIHYYLALLHAFRGQTVNLRKAKEYLDYVIQGDGDNPVAITEDEQRLKDTFSMLIGVNNRLIQKIPNDVLRRAYIRDELYYLWRYSDAIIENEALKAVRQRNLVSSYGNVINILGKRYNDYYRDVVEQYAETNLDMANRIQAINEQAIEAANNPAENNPAPAPAPEPPAPQ